MREIDNKGFTLVEMLAVVVILGVLVAIMIPSVNGMINKNKEQNKKDFKSSVIRATQILLSDYRYDIKLSDSCDENKRKVSLKIGDDDVIKGGEILVAKLVEYGYLSEGENGNGESGSSDTRKVLVEYDCSTKDYVIQFDKESI